MQAIALEDPASVRALWDLEVFAHDIASGREPRSRDIASTLLTLRLASPRGNWLLRILGETAARLDCGPTVRRQFFHAARAYLSLQRDRTARAS